MIFKKMEINNFRQFRGEHRIAFSTDKEKNVTVILGDNGAGKTTLLQAFNWCLYGQLKLENPDELLNKNVLKNMNIGEENIVEVLVEFEHNGKLYSCRNRKKYIKTSENSVRNVDSNQIYTITDETGETKRTNENAIREIFPSDLSIYFLFDGERMQDLGDNQKIGRKDLSNAVTNLLGLDVLKITKEHLKKVKKEFETEFVSDNSDELDRINEELKETDIKIEEEKEKKEKLEEDIIELEKKASKLNEILVSFAVLKELQNKRVELNNQKTIIQRDIDSKKKSIFQISGGALANYLINNAIIGLQNKIANTELSDKSIEGIEGLAITSILERGYCICGCNINENEQARNTLLDLKEYLPPESYSILLKTLEADMNNTLENNSMFKSNFNKAYEEYSKLLNQRDLIENRIAENERAIDDVGDRDLEQYNEQYKMVRQEIARKNQEIGSCGNQIDIYKNYLKKLEDERSKLTVSNNINDEVQKKVDVCEILIEEIGKRLDEKEKNVRELLEKNTSSLLSEMLNTTKFMEIMDDYNFVVYDEYKTKTLSEGEKIVVSFAFVGSIISVAKQMIDKENSNNEDKKFTLVMDAPFAKLDIEHKRNVTKRIPNLTDQIILFSADSQWNGTVEDTLIGKVGKMYNLAKDRSGITNIELIKEEV